MQKLLVIFIQPNKNLVHISTRQKYFSVKLVPKRGRKKVNFLPQAASQACSGFRRKGHKQLICPGQTKREDME